MAPVRGVILIAYVFTGCFKLKFTLSIIFFQLSLEHTVYDTELYVQSFKLIENCNKRLYFIISIKTYWINIFFKNTIKLTPNLLFFLSFQDFNEQCPYSLSPVSIKSQKLLRSPRKATRKISRIPFKVLDAPELQDDFYLNLVDWSAQNVLAVGLGSCVYLWSACTSQVSKTYRNMLVLWTFSYHFLFTQIPPLVVTQQYYQSQNKQNYPFWKFCKYTKHNGIVRSWLCFEYFFNFMRTIVIWENIILKSKSTVLFSCWTLCILNWVLFRLWTHVLFLWNVRI